MVNTSVVVPTFNNRTTIEATMDSILSQDLGDFEVIVSDHGSTDGTWSVVSGIASDPRVQLIRAVPGGGAASNWNAATAAARGRLLRLVCGDDVLAPGTLSHQQHLFDSASPDVVMVSGRAGLLSPRGRALDNRRRRDVGVLGGDAAVRRTARAGTNILGEPFANTVRLDVLREVGGWGSAHGFLLDLETWTRLLRRGSVLVDPDLAGWFRVSPGQWSARLARGQSQAFADYLDSLATDSFWGLSRGDVRLGRSRARVLAPARRLVYASLAASGHVKGSGHART